MNLRLRGHALTPKEQRIARERWRRQLPRYALIGLLNAGIDLGIFNLLLFMNPTRDAGQLVAYNTLAVAAAIINSYFWNSRWTFRYKPKSEPCAKRRKRRALFAGQACLNIAINNAILAGLAVAISAWGWHLSSVFSTGDAAKVVATLVASGVSFVLMKFLVFRRRQEPEASASVL
jgi:putative flippase GtrA